MIPEPELAVEEQSAPPLWDWIADVVEHRLGAPVPGLLLDPQPQLPVGVITDGSSQVAVASGRFRLFPGVGWERCARLGVHAAASGAAATGLPLRCLSVSLSLHPSVTEKQLTEFWRRIHRDAGKLEMAVIANSTATDPFASPADAGSCVAVAMGQGVQAVTAGASRPGDLLLMTQSAGIEAAALLGLTRQGEIEGTFGEGFAEDAAQMYRSLSTTMESAAAGRVGLGPEGVTAMHNVGSAGLLQGIRAMARASGLGFEFDRAGVMLTDEVDALLSHFELDPLLTASQGVLLVTCRPEAEGPLRHELARIGVDCAVFGSVSDSFEGVRALNEGSPLDVEGLADRRLPQILAGSSARPDWPV